MQPLSAYDDELIAARSGFPAGGWGGAETAILGAMDKRPVLTVGA
jgi:hypothetical protein